MSLLKPKGLRRGHPRFYEILKEIESLHDRKNSNYASDQDPLSNFKECERMGLESWKGALVRMGDKWSRLMELSKGKQDLVGESFEDTLLDMAVYAIIAKILYEKR